MITETKFAGRDAYKFSDGKTEAIIVPTLGRVMSYGLVGGPNQLFHDREAKPDPQKPTAWVNYGGDKTWPAPQSQWSLWQKSGGWPPPREWDGMAHTAEILSGGKLQVASKMHPGMGARVVRTYSMSEAGEFVVEQSIEKMTGGPLSLSIWSITQVPHPDAIFVRANPESAYKNNFHFIMRDKGAAYDIAPVRPDLVQVKPSKTNQYKIGVDSPVVALASIKDGVAFVQKSALPKGEYPDGALGAGFPIEIYNNHKGPEYVELEVLGPLRNYFGSKDGKSVGTSFSHTVRWSLHKLQTPVLDEAHDEVARLLN